MYEWYLEEPLLRVLSRVGYIYASVYSRDVSKACLLIQEMKNWRLDRVHHMHMG
jgi:hypothetical protein